jgi:opine dehydrogenase
MSVAILGAGHGGLALAGHLAREGHRVTLWNRSPDRIRAVAARNTIHLTLPKERKCLASLAGVTCDLPTALAEARHVLIALPASAHADLAYGCAPWLQDGQTVLLLPGRTGGALEFRRILRQAGCRADVLLGEAATFPFAARTVGPAEAAIYGTKTEVLAAALPAVRNRELLAEWQPLLPMLRPARSVLQTGLANLGAILHPVITLLNAERIRAGHVFDFYTQGVTSAVAEMLSAADRERLRIARAYGIATPSLPEWIASAYGHRADTLERAVGGNPAYVGIKAPTTLSHRYLLEDVPTGLIPLIELGLAAGLDLPILESLVARGRAALAPVRWQGERTLASLGLAGLGPNAVRAAVAGRLCSTERGITRVGSDRCASRIAAMGIRSMDLLSGVGA